MTRSILCLLPLLAALASCGDRAEEREPSDPTAGPVEAPAAPAIDAPAPDAVAVRTPAPSPADYRTVILERFECGDNCYLTVRPPREGAEARSILCTAPQCDEWRDAGALPSDLVGASAQVAFGRGDQRDAAGNVMNARVRTIADIGTIDVSPPPAEEGSFAPMPENDPELFTDEPAE